METVRKDVILNVWRHYHDDYNYKNEESLLKAFTELKNANLTEKLICLLTMKNMDTDMYGRVAQHARDFDSVSPLFYEVYHGTMLDTYEVMSGIKLDDVVKIGRVTFEGKEWDASDAYLASHINTMMEYVYMYIEIYGVSAEPRYKTPIETPRNLREIISNELFKNL